MIGIACCNFPTTLVVLDDDEDFLESIRGVLSEKYNSLGVSNPSQAREILSKNRGWVKSLLQQGVARVYSEEDPSLFSVSMNVALLKEKIYDPQRFGHTAIVIIDYDMPEKNGLEFVRSLDDSQLKIIMLTGKAQQNTVIKAFNEQEIHRYISKGDPDYLQTLLQYVNELQQEFFLDFSKFILDSLKESETDIFENKSFIDLFNKTVRDNEIIEYYLLDESGSFFLQDAKAKKQLWLLVKSEQEMQHLHELAQDDPDAPPDMVKKLENREALVHFHNPKDSVASAVHWKLISAKPLDKEKQYYYALVKNGENDYFKIDNSRIQSYSKFLSKK